jgi:ABC-type multidrug transport system fused ATPase/permease subunit
MLKGNYRTYYQFVKPYKHLIAFTLIIGMIKFAIPLASPLLIKYIVDDLVMADLTLQDKLERLYWVIGIGIVLFIFVRGPIEYYRQYYAQLVVSRILFDIRNTLYAHIQKLSVRFYQNRKVGEIISRFINDVEQTKNLVEVGLMNVWLDLFTLVLVTGIMLYLNPLLTLAAISIIPLYAIAVKILYKRLRMLTKDRSQALAEVQAYLHERIQGIPVIRSFTLERYEESWFGRKNTNFLDKAISQTRWNALTVSIINTLTDIAPLLVLGYGAYEVMQGKLSLGAFVAFFGYLERMYGPLRRLVNASTVLTQASASLERVVEFMNEPYEIADQSNAIELHASKGQIEFDHVWFKYQETQDWALRDISLQVKSGQTVALVGPSGGGKSTLVGLLPRFYDIQAGDIRLDGNSITALTQLSLRKQIGIVLQDNILFSGSIRENISMGDPEASEEMIIAAATAANAHGFIEELPSGYHTEIGERGVKLSGGQKQRIAIARVFLKNPSILVLDEATSALDLESEHLIQQSLDLLAKGRTTLIVAHRLSTITHADQIIVIDGGEIKERGTHKELMDLKGIYFNLFTIQRMD